jgi:hypothetical protein
MALSKDYKGPVSGGMTIKADGTTESRSYTQEEDPVLTRDELNATADFRALPPNEQLREVRRPKWNLGEITNQRDSLRVTVQSQDREILTLRAKLAVFTPEGYMMPSPAALLLADAADHGWRTVRAWHTDEGGDDPHARLEVAITNGWHTFQLSWSVDPLIRGGHGRMIRRGLARKLQGPWYDAPSLLKIHKIITEESEKQES